MDKIFEILGSSPVVSIICTTVVILALIYVLRKQIVAYVKKKYNLYTENDVLQKMNEAIREDRKRQGILTEFKKNE